MRLHQIKIIYIFAPDPEEIYLSGKKIAFFKKTMAKLASWQHKHWFNG